MQKKRSYLNTDNISRSTEKIEFHPLKPCIDNKTEILFLGSFPPKRSKWSKGFDFFYPNFINDHWRIMGQIFFCNKDFFVDNKNKTFLYEKILDFVEKHHIGYYDTAEAVHRLKDNASDKYLDIVKKTDLMELLANAPKCRHIITTGEKATTTLCQQLGIETIPKVGQSVTVSVRHADTQKNIGIHRLPSSSRAYPMPLKRKAELYHAMLVKVCLCTPQQ